MKKYPLLIFILMNSFWATSQNVSINNSGSTPHTSAMLDVASTTKGMLVPRMDSTQRKAILNPANGLLVFDLDTQSFWFKDSTGWMELLDSRVGNLSDQDADTRVEMEANVDEDKIRFVVEGTEQMQLDGKTMHLIAPGESVFIGDQSGINDDGSSNQNTFVGIRSGFTNSSGGANTFLGYQSGYANLGSSHNTYAGYLSGTSNQTGFSNAFLGSNAGNKNVTGYYNTFIGRSAGFENVIGVQNTLIGKDAGRNILGSGNVCLGHDAGENEMGSNKLYIDNSNSSTPLIWGDFANDVLKINGFLGIGDAYTFPVTDGQYGQVLISDGFGQLSWSPSPDINKLIDTDFDTKIQVEANADEDKIRFRVGGEEIAVLEKERLAMDYVNIGSGAGGANTSDTNLNIGVNAGSNLNGGTNVAIGTDALSGPYLYAITENVAIGFTAMGAGSGEQSTAVGYRAMYGGGEKNTAVGYQALKNGGRFDTAMGYGAMEENEGYYNVAIGYNALFPNLGTYNTAIGATTMDANRLGYYNTALGANALGGNVNGGENVAVGLNALGNASALNMNRNTAVGNNTLISNVSGNDITAIGHSANVAAIDLNNATVIGADAFVSCSDCLVLDTDADVGIRNSNPQSDLHIKHQNGGSSGNGLRLENGGDGNYIRMYTTSSGDGDLWMYSDDSPTSTIAELDAVTGVWSATSDARKKRDIQKIKNILPEILKLRPKTYQFKKQGTSQVRHFGFLAQEVAPLFPSLVNYNQESDNYTMNYSGFGILAIAAIQELVQENTELQNQIKSQQSTLDNIQNRLNEMEAQLSNNN